MDGLFKFIARAAYFNECPAVVCDTVYASLRIIYKQDNRLLVAQSVGLKDPRLEILDEGSDDAIEVFHDILPLLGSMILQIHKDLKALSERY